MHTLVLHNSHNVSNWGPAQLEESNIYNNIIMNISHNASPTVGEQVCFSLVFRLMD